MDKGGGVIMKQWMCTERDIIYIYIYIYTHGGRENYEDSRGKFEIWNNRDMPGSFGWYVKNYYQITSVIWRSIKIINIQFYSNKMYYFPINIILNQLTGLSPLTRLWNRKLGTNVTFFGEGNSISDLRLPIILY